MPEGKRYNSGMALVVEGGGMRAAFSSGVTDAFLQAGFNPFSLLIGVSSGATTIASYLAEQEGRNLAIFLDQSCRPEFIRWQRFMRGGDLLDIGWLWQVLQQENPLDCDRLFAQGRDFRIVLSDAVSGDAAYVMAKRELVLDALRASSSIPFMVRQPVRLGDRVYFDGGIADALPVRWALSQPSIERIMVIRTRSRDYVKRGAMGDMMLSRCLRYSGFAQALRRRVAHYNDTLMWMHWEENRQRVMEVCPPADARMAGRLCRDPERLRFSYRVGLDCGRVAMQQWQDSFC